MASILEGSDSFTGINWWIGQVAPRETWAENTLLKNDKDVGTSDRKGENTVYPNRVKVRVVGYHDSIEDPNELPFAAILGNPFISVVQTPQFLARHPYLKARSGIFVSCA